MINLFYNNTSGIAHKLETYPKFRYIRDKMSINISNVLSYYHNRTRAVNNGHIISRLIDLTVPSIDLDIVDYLYHVKVQAPFVCKTLQITSNINYGKTHESIFFGRNSKELLMYVENDIDIYTIKDTWQTLSAINPIYIDDPIVDYRVPNGTKDYAVDTLSVFEIDPVLLLLQYKYWALSKQLENSSTNVNVFVATVVLPNMIPKLVDLGLYRRFEYYMEDISIPQTIIKHPILVYDYTPLYDEIIKYVANKYKHRTIFIERILQEIPAVTNINMLEVLKVNTRFHTTQSLWVDVLSRIFTVKRLVVFIGNGGIVTNSYLLRRIPIKLRQLENQLTRLESLLPESIYNKYMATVTVLKNKLGKR